MSDPIAQVKEIAADLIGCAQGSRRDLEAELDELGVGRDAKPSAAFDEIAFLCDGCNWYCSVDELHNESAEQLCDDCHIESCEDEPGTDS